MNIKRIRQLRGLTQVELSEMSGMTQPTVSRAEKADDGVTLGNFKAIAEALNVRLADLFADERSISEQVILETYRRLPPDRQRGWEEMARIALGPQPPSSQTDQTVRSSSKRPTA